MENDNIRDFLSMRAYETKEMNLERRKTFFIVYNKTGNFEEAMALSNISVNMKYLGCKYNP